jgi:DNA-binding NarL/FixJ family response regulator
MLALMAEGLTNTDIAKRALPERRTVEAHVRHPLMELDLPEAEAGTAACSPCSRIFRPPRFSSST